MEKALGKLEDAQKEKWECPLRRSYTYTTDTIYDGLRNYLWAKEIYITF